MRVKECMCSNVVCANSETSLEQIAKLMQENDVGCIPICNDEKNVIGFVTDRDIITRCVANNKNCAQTKASDVVTKNVIKTTPDTEIEDVESTMSKNQIRRVPVIENNKIVGIITIGDLAQNKDVSCKDVGLTMECICKCE